MSGFISDMLDMAETTDLSPTMVLMMTAAYNEGRLVYDGTDESWDQPDFDFRSEMVREIIDAANYAVEAKRQNVLSELDTYMFLRSFRHIINRLLIGTVGHQREKNS